MVKAVVAMTKNHLRTAPRPLQVGRPQRRNVNPARRKSSRKKKSSRQKVVLGSQSDDSSVEIVCSPRGEKYKLRYQDCTPTQLPGRILGLEGETRSTWRGINTLGNRMNDVEELLQGHSISNIARLVQALSNTVARLREDVEHLVDTKEYVTDVAMQSVLIDLNTARHIASLRHESDESDLDDESDSDDNRLLTDLSQQPEEEDENGGEN